MRTLRYAILGLVDRKPATGYDIAREFKEKELSNFWSARHSQIYPELRKLTEEGLLEYEVEISGEIQEKKVYRITRRGKREFLAWLLRDEVMQPTFKDRFRLRMYFVSRMPSADAAALLKSQLVQRKRKLDFLLESQEKYQELPEYSSDQFGDYLVLRGAILREQAYVDWLEESLRLVGKSSQSSVMEQKENALVH